jgi:hypothetical protein
MTTDSSTSKDVKSAFQTALTGVRLSMASAPAAIAVFALAAGLSTAQAQVWSSNTYENLGRQIGQEMGSQTGSNRWDSSSRVTGMILGQVIGSAGKTMDASTAQKTLEQKNIEAARAQAQRDAIYDAERLRIDPNYKPGTRYDEIAARAKQSNDGYEAIRRNLLGNGKPPVLAYPPRLEQLSER